MQGLAVILLIFGFAILGLLARHMIDPPCSGFCDDIGYEEEHAGVYWPDVLIIAVGAAAGAGGMALLVRTRKEYKPLSIFNSSHESRRS